MSRKLGALPKLMVGATGGVMFVLMFGRLGLGGAVNVGAGGTLMAMLRSGGRGGAPRLTPLDVP